MAKNGANHYILRITYQSDGNVVAIGHLMQFFTGYSSTYANQTAFSLSGEKPYAFFAGKLFDFDNMVGTTARTQSAGYLMKYAMVQGENLVTECCKSYKVEFSSNSNNKYEKDFKASETGKYRFSLSSSQITFANIASFDSTTYISLTVADAYRLTCTERDGKPLTDKTYQPTDSSSPTSSDAPTFLADQCPSGSVSSTSLTWLYTSIPVSSAFLTQAPGTGVVQWTNSIPPGTHDITIIGTFPDPDTRTFKTTFRLTVVDACTSVTITSKGDTTLNYVISQAGVSGTFKGFQFSLSGCNIQYTLEMKDSSGVYQQLTAAVFSSIYPYLSFHQDSLALNVATCTNSMLVGTYYLRLKGVATSSSSIAFTSMTVTFIDGQCAGVSAADLPTPTTTTNPTPYEIQYKLARIADLQQAIANAGVSPCFSFKIFKADQSGEATLPNGVTFEPTTQVITIVKTTTEDIGTLPQKTYDYKLRAEHQNGGLTFSEFKIIFIHQCTEATIQIASTPVPLNVDYKVIIDGIKFYTVAPSNLQLLGEPAGVQCFVFQLNQETSDQALLSNSELSLVYSRTSADAYTYSLKVVALTASYTNVDQVLITNFRVAGKKNIDGQPFVSFLAAVNFYHECIDASISVLASEVVLLPHYLQVDGTLSVQATTYLKETLPAGLAAGFSCYIYDLDVQESGLSVAPLPSFIQYVSPLLSVGTTGNNNLGLTTASKTFNFIFKAKKGYETSISASATVSLTVNHECTHTGKVNITPKQSSFSYNLPSVTIDNSGAAIPASEADQFDKTLIAFTDLTTSVCITRKWTQLDSSGSALTSLPPYFSAYGDKNLIIQSGGLQLNSLSTAVHLEYEVTNRVTMEIKKAKFDVVVYHYCSDKVLIAPSSNLGRAYDMFSGPQTIPQSKFTTEALCEVDVTFYNKDSAQITTLPILSPYFSFIKSTFLIDVPSTSDVGMIGVHQFTMRQSMRYGSSFADQLVVIRMNCMILNLKHSPSDLVDTVKSMTKTHVYTIGDQRLRIDLVGFIQQVDCKLPTTYKFIQKIGDALPSYIRGDVNQISGRPFIEVFSNTRKGIMGSIEIAVLIAGEAEAANPPNGDIKRAEMVMPIQIIIPNYGPPKFKVKPKDIRLKVGDSWPLRFSKMRDPDLEDKPFLDEIDFGKASNFITGSFSKYVIKPMDNTTDPGFYLVNVKISDDNPVSQSTFYVFRIIVEPAPTEAEVHMLNITHPAAHQSQNKTKGGQDLSVKIKSITSSGLVTVSFSQAINVPRNFTNIDADILDIRVRPAPDTKKEFTKISSWNITDFQRLEIKIQLDFETPLRISTSSYIMDALEIRFLIPEFFQVIATREMVKQDLLVDKVIPRQMTRDGASLALLASEGPAKSTFNTMMYGNLAVNIVLSASLQMLWGMINVMQLIVKFPILNVTFPQNAVTFYTFINELANFDILPTDMIRTAIFSFSDSPELDQNLNQMGYQSQNIIETLGSMVLYLVGFFFLVAFALMIRAFKNRYQWLNVFYTYLANILFWNMILRMILEGYLEFAVSSIENVENLKWNNLSDYIDSYFSIIVLSVVLIFPFFVWYLLWGNYGTLNKDENIQKYGSLFNEIRADSKESLLYNVFFMLRRLLIATLATQVEQMSCFQIQGIVFHCILLIAFIVYVRPFEQPLLNNMEIFNECSILVAAYHLFAFTAFVEDPEIQYQAGWSLIGATIINILVNMLVMLWVTGRQLKLALRKAWHIFQQKKAHKAAVSEDLKHPKAKLSHIDKLEDINSYDPPESLALENPHKHKRKSNKVPPPPSSSSRRTRKKVGIQESGGGHEMQGEGRWKRAQQAQTLAEIQKEYWKGMKDFENKDQFRDYQDERNLAFMRFQSYAGVKDTHKKSNLDEQKDRRKKKTQFPAIPQNFDLFELDKIEYPSPTLAASGFTDFPQRARAPDHLENKTFQSQKTLLSETISKTIGARVQHHTRGPSSTSLIDTSNKSILADDLEADSYLVRNVNEAIERQKEVRKITDRHSFMDNQKVQSDARENKKPSNQEILAKYKLRK